MARTKPEKIPAGDEYIPDVPEAELESMIAAIPSCNKELLILMAALKRKRCGSISGISRDVGRPYATVYGCCACTSVGWTGYHSTVRGFWTKMPAS